MYQSIDDDIDEEHVETKPVPFWAWLLGLAVIAAVFAAVYLSRTPQTSAPDRPAANSEARAAYHTALSETGAALRRARLQDFLKVYPNSRRADAVMTQLDVINLSDAQAWDRVTKLVYNARISKQVKLDALAAYDAQWGGDLLGGRSEEVTKLRGEISGMTEPEPKPDRRLEAGPSPIPQTIKSDVFAGGPRRVVITPPPPAPKPAPVTQPKPVAAKIVMPTVRRNSTPRYPRKALRRKVNAIVTLKLNIDAKGKVKMTELVSVSADRYEKDFVKAAERAAMRTRFNPKTIDDKPVAATGVLKRYRFDSNQ